MLAVSVLKVPAILGLSGVALFLSLLRWEYRD